MNPHASTKRLPTAVIGAGGIGRFHIERALASEAVSLAAIADPTDSAASADSAYRPASTVSVTPNAMTANWPTSTVAA